jgi:hypothetical protein
VLALSLFAPARALAACGDHVTMARQPGDAVPLAPVYVPATPTPILSAARGAPELLAGQAIRHEMPRPIPCPRCPATPDQPPCQGPSCSGSQSPLTVPATTAPGPHDDTAVCWWSVPRFGDTDPIPYAFLDYQAARIHHVLPIYHPPRSA